MRNKTLAAILALFFGSIGGHRFYLGQVGLGILYLVFAFTFIPFFLGLIDALVFFGMSEEEFNFRYNKSKFQEQHRNPRSGQSPSTREYEASVPERRNVPPSDIERRKSSTIDSARRSGNANRPTVRSSSGEFKKSGIKKFKEFQYQEAIEDFNKVLETNNRDIATHFNIACAYSLTEQKEKCYYHINQAVLLGFTDFERIHTHESLAFMRIQPEYFTFKDSGYRVLPEFSEEVEDAAPPEDTANVRPAPMLNAAPDNSLLEEISRLESLRDLGVLTDQEFLEQKEKLERGA